MSRFIAPPSGDNGAELADWLEATMLLESRVRAARSRIRKALRSALHPSDDELEAAVNFLLNEMSARERIAPRTYPFRQESEGGAVLQVSTASCLYSFLLCMSVSRPFREERRWSETDRWFDRVVLQALKRSLGEGSLGIRFGHPPTDGRPTGFQDAIGWLCAQMGLGRGTAERIERPNDDGVDVVVWRPFGDGRTGFPVILAQCTVRRDPGSWVDKARECDAVTWVGWVDFGRPAQTCLALPFAVPSVSDRWDQLRRATNIVLDRMRISELLDGVELDDEQEICKWVERELEAMRMAG